MIDGAVEITRLEAVDPDGDPLTFVITGGADAGAFDLEPTPGF